MGPNRSFALITRLLIVAFAFSFADCGGESALFRRDIGGGDASASDGRDAGAGGKKGAGGGPGTGGARTNAGGAPGSGGMAAGGSFGSGGAAMGAGGSGGNANNGMTCTNKTQCTSGHCVDGVCCDLPCAATCFTCNATASPGTCVPAEGGTDPRNECDDKGATSCGTNGVCNGAGACRFYPAGQSCPGTAACNATNSGVVTAYVCSGNGACVAGATQDCKGFLCSAATCGTSCTTDANCAPGAFCSAHVCLAGPVNLAGNGDLEYGTLDGWSGFASAGTLSLSSPTASGIAHGGDSSALLANRSQRYLGPAYVLPTGLGRYNVSVWGTQTADATLKSVVNIALYCNTQTFYLGVNGFGTNVNKGTWTQFSGIMDFVTQPSVPADCLPTATPPGVLRQAILYFNQDSTTDGTPVAMPDLYADDLVVQVTDGHNLIGNPNFEANGTDGWSAFGNAVVGLSQTVHNTGTSSLVATSRTASTAGPRYVLPIGAARYNVSFHVLHNGTSAHDLALAATYTCLGGTQTSPPPAATVAATPHNTWTTLSGTVTLPPANAPAGCRLVQADVHVQQEPGTCAAVECPDIYVDDASITLAP